MQVLLLSGCRPDIKNNYGDTPLHTAARYGHAGVIRILVSAKCNTSEQNKVSSAVTIKTHMICESNNRIETPHKW